MVLFQLFPTKSFSFLPPDPPLFFYLTYPPMTHRDAHKLTAFPPIAAPQETRQ